MQIGAIWDAKVIHLNYTLKGKVLVVDDAMLGRAVDATTLPFAINDVTFVSGADDRMPQVGDLITVELTTKAIFGRSFDVGTVNVKLTDVVITDIDKYDNLYVTASFNISGATTGHPYNTLF